MRTNGTISFINLPSETQYNEDGEPILVEKSWSDPVECWVQDITEDRRAQSEGGLHTERAFEILIEGRECNVGELVRLTRRKKLLGEFSVSRVRNLLFDRIKIYANGYHCQ